MAKRSLRILHLLLTPLLLAVLSYDYARNVDRTQLEVSELRFPVESAGVTAFIPFGVVRQVDDRSLTVVHRGEPYVVAGRVDRAKPGDVISLEVLARDDRLDAVSSHIHRFRRFKWLSGVVALIFLAVLFAQPFLGTRS